MNIGSVSDNIVDNDQSNTKVINLGMQKENILKKMLNIIGINYSALEDLQGKQINRDLLLEDNVV